MLTDSDVLSVFVDILLLRLLQLLLLLLELTLAGALAAFLLKTTTTCLQLDNANLFLLQQTL